MGVRERLPPPPPPPPKKKKKKKKQKQNGKEKERREECAKAHPLDDSYHPSMRTLKVGDLIMYCMPIKLPLLVIEACFFIGSGGGLSLTPRKYV